MEIDDLRPTAQNRVIDLVESAGLDISDWSNFKGGADKAASNPKYCYEWSYEDDEKQLIVLNLWYWNLEKIDGNIVQSLNLRKTSADADSASQSRRAIKMDFSLQKATRLNIPLRVIICDGKKKGPNDTKATAEMRLLDKESWYVGNYDSDSGECCLVRGARVALYVDQFNFIDQETNDSSGKERTSTVYHRSPQIRENVLSRAKGHCEWCSEKGFVTKSGYIYLESHHIHPLSEGGADTIENVIALCPNHHREAKHLQRHPS